MGRTIKHAEVNINGKILHARITKFEGGYGKPDYLTELPYMVVFRESGREPKKDITFHKYESMALDKFQEFLEKYFLNFPFERKVKNEIAQCDEYLYDPQ